MKQSTALYQITLPGKQALVSAMRYLARFVPDQYVAVHLKIVGIAYHPTVCGPDAIACTGGPRILPGWAVLAEAPEWSDPVELAVSIAHEARHMVLWPDGSRAMLSHTCMDCRDEAERATDWIYQEDQRVRTAIMRGLANEALRKREQTMARRVATRYLAIDQRVAVEASRLRQAARVHAAIYGW